MEKERREERGEKAGDVEKKKACHGGGSSVT